MKIKKHTGKFLLMASALLMLGCQKVTTDYGPNDDIIVITLHDKSTNFGDLKTFEISDSIGFINDGVSSYGKSSGATSVINNIVRNFNDRGYKRVGHNQGADFAVNVTAIKILNIETYYPGYWYGYAGYYGGAYYGYPYYSYYYPYTYSYAYTTGSLMIEVIDFKHRDVANNRIIVPWNCLLNGYADSGASPDLVNTYVNKGFAQSPYIQTSL